MAGDRLVQLVLLPSRLEAEVLVAQLKSQGVEAVVFASDGEGWLPHMSLIQGIRVMVPESDLSDATEMLEDVLGPQ